MQIIFVNYVLYLLKAAYFYSTYYGWYPAGNSICFEIIYVYEVKHIQELQVILKPNEILNFSGLIMQLDKLHSQL